MSYRFWQKRPAVVLQGIWGDPLLSGSVLVLAYAITGVLALRTARGLEGRERALWVICGAVLVFQAFNTPLDLHAFVWTTGRCLAKLQGWYKARAQVQLNILIGVIATVGLVLALLGYLFRGKILANAKLVLGVAIAVGFTGVKGISIHGLAALYGRTLGPMKVADWIELSGIALAALAVFQRRRALAKRRSGLSEPDHNVD